jgi:hypothetical protein
MADAAYAGGEEALVQACVDRYSELEHEDVRNLLEAFRSLLCVEDSAGPDRGTLRMPLSMVKQYVTNSSLFTADIDDDELTPERVSAILNGEMARGPSPRWTDKLRAWR